jgi:hypothetical protein
MKRRVKPLFVYSDDGGGDSNKMLDADITGIPGDVRWRTASLNG